MDTAWKITRSLYRAERSTESWFFDLYKQYNGMVKTKGKRQLLMRNADLKNKYTDNRCFIVGNGPSLNSIDLSLLKDEYVFTVNQASKLEQFSSMNTDFHFWSDGRFFDISSQDEADLELLETMKKVNSPNNKPIVFYEIGAYEMVRRYHLDDTLDIRYFAAVQFTKERYLKKDNIDFTRVVCNWPTVVQIAITAAFYMGFTEIYLIGVDSTGIINIAKAKMKEYSDGTEYGYTVNDNDIKRMEKTNSFYTFEQELRNQAFLFDDYALISQYAIRKGIRIYNATPGGLLEYFERVKYEDVVRKNGC